MPIPFAPNSENGFRQEWAHCPVQTKFTTMNKENNRYQWLYITTKFKNKNNLPEEIQKNCVIEEDHHGMKCEIRFYLSFDPAFKHDWNWLKLIEANKIRKIDITDNPPNLIF